MRHNRGSVREQALLRGCFMRQTDMASGFLTGALKWLIVPIVMAAVGYFVIGPRIGGNSYLESKAATVKEAVAKVAQPQPSESEAEAGKYSKVKLDVNVTKDDRKKPDSTTEKPKKREYFSPDAGKSYDEIPELPQTPADSGAGQGEGTQPPAGGDPNGWN